MKTSLICKCSLMLTIKTRPNISYFHIQIHAKRLCFSQTPFTHKRYCGDNSRNVPTHQRPHTCMTQPALKLFVHIYNIYTTTAWLFIVSFYPALADVNGRTAYFARAKYQVFSFFLWLCTLNKVVHMINIPLISPCIPKSTCYTIARFGNTYAETFGPTNTKMRYGTMA